MTATSPQASLGFTGRVLKSTILDLLAGQLMQSWLRQLRPLQINFLFPVLDSGIFAFGQAVHFHYFIIRLAAFQAIICLAQP